MKKQYNITKNALIVSGILCLLQAILLALAFDTKRIVLFVICAVLFLVILVIFIMYSLEIKKIVFEIEWDNYKVRLVEYDDYQKIRVFLDDTPISNTKEEAALLEEYYKKTIDMTRIRYHYLVLKDQEIIGIIYAKNNKKSVNVEIVKLISDEEIIKHKLSEVSTNKKIELLIK